MTEKKKKAQKLRVHSANKINNYNRGGGKENKKGKKSKSTEHLCQNIRIINVFLESLLSESFPLLGSYSPLHLPRRPSITVLISGPAVGAAQILIWSYSSLCSCLQCPQLSELVRFLLWELSVAFMYSIDRVCLVDHVDLICS